MQKTRNKRLQLHFIGIGGIGMSGIAEVLLNQGYTISGSDAADSDLVRRLIGLGARIAIGHAPENVDGAEVVVVSSAIRQTNPELLEARRRGIPVIRRAEMLGELMRGKVGIAVSGTHGKTTTSSMLGTILTHAGNDPTLVIGGKVDSLGGNAKLGQGELVVAEADESDGSFHHLPATYAIVTNIDADHLDHFGTIEEVEKAFVQFVGKLPFYGSAAVCLDDAGVRKCLPKFTKPVMTYALNDPEADFIATDLRIEGMSSSFLVRGRQGPGQPHKDLGRATLHVPGCHNVLNALGAIAIAIRLDLPFEKIAEGLASFRGVRRRFETRFRNASGSLLVIDDYGHHPTEVAATLASARAFWPGRILTIFQPHRYSRTRDCFDSFLNSFIDSDSVLITDIYPAGEEPIPGVDSESLARAISLKKDARYAGTLEATRNLALAEIRDGDLVLCMGAGSITRLAGELSQALAEKSASETRKHE